MSFEVKVVCGKLV
ncbi:hypothetical protein K6U70_02230 [Vibrio vulnificus]|nr:hypothetical protein [Vibrio vulnificus]